MPPHCVKSVVPRDNGFLQYIPAIMIIAVDVEHLLALYTEHTANLSVLCTFLSAHPFYPESTHSVRPGES